MDSEKDVIFHDSLDRAWTSSFHRLLYNVSMLSSIPRPCENLLMLPYHVTPWWPLEDIQDETSDFYYSFCAICNVNTVELARLCIDFTATYWSVRIICTRCKPDTLKETSYCGFVLNVMGQLKPIIEQACAMRDNRCLICEKEDCSDLECETVYELINRTETQDLMELMYRNQIDIVSCLRFKICHRPGCNSVSAEKMYSCGICRRVLYCSRHCKRIDASFHKEQCVEFWKVWEKGE